MDIKYFEYVVEIVGCGPINKATQNLQMLQPNLSVCIKNLEQEFDFPIPCRQYSGIRLTSEGEPFLRSARRIATELETAHNIPSMFSYKDSPFISCTYSSGFMNYFFKFRKKKPPTACEDSSKGAGFIQTIRDVVEQRYRTSPFCCSDMVSDTHYALAKKYNLKPILIARNRPLILLTPKKNPLSHKREILSDSITDYKFIMCENFKFDEWLKIPNFKNDNNTLHVFDRGGLIDAIRQSRYVTVMMRRFIDTYSEDCMKISIVDSPLGMDAYYLHHASYTTSSREKQLIRELEELFAENPAHRFIQISKSCLAIGAVVFPPLPPSSTRTVTTSRGDSAGVNLVNQA